MLAIMKLALKNNKPILLRATEEAVPFYKKLYFEKDPANRQPHDGFDGITPMKLTVEKFTSLLSLEFIHFIH